MPPETLTATETTHTHTETSTCTLQRDNPSVNTISGDSTLSVSKDPILDDVAETAETPVGAQVELRVSCTKCSKLAKRVKKLQKNNSYLRKRSRELKNQLKTVNR